VGLARLPKLPQPPLPEIDEELTAGANEVLQEARDRVAKLGKARDLTLDDCNDIVDAVAAEMDASAIP
jgi:hypothetical protein